MICLLFITTKIDRADLINEADEENVCHFDELSDIDDHQGDDDAIGQQILIESRPTFEEMDRSLSNNISDGI